MTRDVRCYVFEASVPADEIEDTLLLAVLAAEGLHGPARVQRDAAYCFDGEKHACVIDVESVVGRDIASIFSGFAIREFGQDAFRITRKQEAGDPMPEELSA